MERRERRKWVHSGACTFLLPPFYKCRLWHKLRENVVLAIISHQVMRDIFRPLYFKSWIPTIRSWNKLRKVVRRINKASKLKSYIKKEQIWRKLTLPWLIKFIDMLQTSDENKGYVNDFISCLGKDLIPICKKNLNIKVLVKESFLDKRFSKLMQIL